MTRALINPALWIEPSEEWKKSFKSAFNVTDHPFLQIPSIAPKKIICVDKDEKTVSKLGVHIDEKAKKELQQNILRFSHLKVELNATDYRNIESFKNEIDVLIASEFIEHLDDDCLNEFGPRVLGNWKPKTVLITTPNYSFNVKFKNDSHSQKSYKDPTGRTDRMFRHDDHKFEWTKEEFRSWIEKIAEVYGYQVKFDEIGRGYRLIDDVKEEDLTDGDNARCASHCCILTRILPKEHIATSNAIEEDEKSYKTVHDFMASDKKLCEDGDLNIFESTFDHLAFETEQGLMANMYEVWLDEDIRKTYCGNLETFLPDAKSLQNQEYSLVEKDGDIFILKKLL